MTLRIPCSTVLYTLFVFQRSCQRPRSCTSSPRYAPLSPRPNGRSSSGKRTFILFLLLPQKKAKKVNFFPWEKYFKKEGRRLSLVALLSKVSNCAPLPRKNLLIINVARNHHKRHQHCYYVGRVLAKKRA